MDALVEQSLLAFCNKDYFQIALYKFRDLIDAGSSNKHFVALIADEHPRNDMLSMFAPCD